MSVEARELEGSRIGMNSVTNEMFASRILPLIKWMLWDSLIRKADPIVDG